MDVPHPCRNGQAALIKLTDYEKIRTKVCWKGVRFGEWKWDGYDRSYFIAYICYILNKFEIILIN